MQCPFCLEDDFDAIGLKHHLQNYCEAYAATSSPSEEAAQRREEALVKCECCDNGQWFAECCNGTGGCDCHGQPVNMGKCHVCNGTGWRKKDANLKANTESIRGRCFIGSGPRTGYWAGK